MIQMVGVCVFSILAIFTLESVSLIKNEQLGSATLSDLMVILFAIAMNTILLRTSLFDSEESAQEAQKAANALQDANNQLTEQRELLETLNQQQEQTIQDRTEQLRLALDAANAASEAKSQFLSNISHELRTPMNGVVGMTDLLLTTDLSAEQHDYVDTLKISSDAMMSLIEQLLDFTQLQAGMVQLRTETFDVVDCIDEVLDVMTAKAEAKGLELVCYVDAAVPAGVISDLGRLRQILLNLVNNAIKFTESGEVTLVAEVAEEIGDECTLRFAVRDTGIGIPNEHIERMFESFTQMDSSNTRRYEGTGLGLAVCRALATLLGGKIWAESTVGAGSTFYLTVPVEVTAPSAPARPPWSEAFTPHVLLIDDNATVRRYVSQYLDRWGMKTTALSSSGEALAFLNKPVSEASDRKGVDLILLDTTLPTTDSLALAAQLQEASSQKPLLMLVPRDQMHFKEAARRAGFNHFVNKPVKPRNFLTALAQQLSHRAEATPATGDLPAQPVAQLRATASDGERIPDEVFALRILVAEDSALNQKVALAALKKNGQCADVVGDGNEAIAAVERTHYDVIFMDVQMPGMDGLTATRRIRANAERFGYPYIVALTAGAKDADRSSCLKAGMNDFLTKPATAHNLLEALIRSLSMEAPQLDAQEIGAQKEGEEVHEKERDE